MGAVAWLVADPSPLLDVTPTAWELPSPACPLAAWLTQAAGTEAVVSPWRRLGLVAVEDLLHKLLHREARAAVPVAARPLDAVDCGERGGRGVVRSEATCAWGRSWEGWGLSPPGAWPPFCWQADSKHHKAMPVGGEKGGKRGKPGCPITAPPLGRFDHLIRSPHETCSPWLSPGFLLPPLHASPLSSLQILIWEPMGATKPQPTNPTSSFSLEARVHLVFPCLKAFSLPPLIVPSTGSGPAWPLDHTPAPKPLPGPVSRVEMSNAAVGEISKSTSPPPPTSWL